MENHRIARGGTIPALRPSLSSGSLPPLPDHVSDGFRLAHAHDPMHSTIEKMAQSPLKKRLDMSLSGFAWAKGMEYEAAAQGMMTHLEKLEREAVEATGRLVSMADQLKEVESVRQELAQKVGSLSSELVRMEHARNDAMEERNRLQGEMKEIKDVLEAERKGLTERVAEQVAKAEADQRERLAELQKQVTTERIRAVAAETAVQESSRELTSERSLSATRQLACETAGAVLRQCLASLREHSSTATPMTVASDDNSAAAIQHLSSAVRSAVSSVVAAGKQMQVESDGMKEKISLLEDHLKSEQHDNSEMREQIVTMSAALSKAKTTRPMTMDVGVQAVGSQGGGVQERGVQTWGANKKEDGSSQSTDSAPDSKTEEPQSCEGKANVEPLSAFLLRYLQKRFGLLEMNAEWEVGRLRTSLGRVLDVYVRTTTQIQDDA